MKVSAALVLVGLLAAGLTFGIRSTHSQGANCGSVLFPTDVEHFGPTGTKPRPCRGSHDSDAQLAVLLLAGAAIVGSGAGIGAMLTKRRDPDQPQ